MNAIPKLSQLSKLVWRILGCNPGPMTLQGTNVYLVGSGEKRILIDAGQDNFPEYIDSLSQLLADQEVSIDKIIITHWHKDHIGALDDMKSVFKKGLPSVYKFPRLEVPDSPLPDGYNLERLKDNEVLRAGEATLRILYTPGHTTDHAALYLEEEKAIFSGDCILGEGTTVFEDLHNYLLSLKRIMRENPLKIYPGHGPVVTDAKDKIEFYIKHRMERERQIIGVLEQSSPMTPGQIVKIAYKETPVHLHAAAELNVIHHLSKLIKEKRVNKKDDKYYVGDYDYRKL